MVVKIENVTDENDIKFLTILDKHGWHVMHVHNRVGETEPEFSYSTGIYKNFGKPELMVFGLSSELRHSMINGYAEDIKTNRREFSPSAFYDDFLEGFDVFLTEGSTELKKQYACWSDWYYERKPYPLLQCIWPSTNGLWPWDAEASYDFKAMQPLFGPIPTDNNT